jgi:tyrosine-protein kinase Etk/Wzc
MPQETLLSSISTSANAEPEVAAPELFEEREIDLFAVATLLLEKRKLILRFILSAALLTAVVVFGLMKPMYTAEAVFLPPQTSPGSGMAQLASQLGSLGAMGALTGLKSTSDVYLGILGSRTIADGLIAKFDLQQVYKIKKHSEAVKKLESRSSFVAGKNTLITISVQDHDPKRAADLANAYLDALREQNGRLALTEASQRRLFFEEQLAREKNALADAEVELKKTQEQTGLIAPGGQAEMEIETMAQIRAQITSLQVELSAVRQGATEENPEVVRLQTQIAGLQQQLQRLQNDPAKHQPGNIQPPTSKVPELALEYVRKQREVKYHDVLFELIAKQYEAARLDESRDAPVLQVVDRAVIPDKRSGPPRLLALLAGSLFGGIAGIIWAFVTNSIAMMRRDPIKAAKLRALQTAVSARD